MQPKEETIRKIIDIEWPMFRDVNGDGPKASCQNDRQTFEGMRRGQYEAWDEKTCESYLRDLEDAVRQGRSLPTEKYIHMMRSTAPGEYEQLKRLLPPSDPRAVELADKITDKIIAQTVVLHERYPRVSGAGRPLYTWQDGPGVTSVETYQRGELYTYSAATLEALWEHLLALEAKGESLAEKILAGSVAYYGYASLEEAENGQK
jgi:hypothetical protein